MKKNLTLDQQIIKCCSCEKQGTLKELKPTRVIDGCKTSSSNYQWYCQECYQKQQEEEKLNIFMKTLNNYLTNNQIKPSLTKNELKELKTLLEQHQKTFFLDRSKECYL
jgi:hypothetical protein